MAKKIIVVLVLLILIGFGIWIWSQSNSKPTETTSNNQIESENPNPILSVSGFNQTTNSVVGVGQAHSGDLLIFTLAAENPSNQTIPGYVIKINISDLVASATLVDSGGAAYSSTDRVLSWTPLDIPAGQSIQQRFTARVNQLAANASDSVVRLTYNNVLQIGITGRVAGASTSQPAKSATYRAPVTGPNENLIGILALLFTTAWFFRRRLGITSR